MNILSIKAVFIFMTLTTFSFQISAQEKEKGKLADFEDEVKNKSEKNDDDKEDNSTIHSGNSYSKYACVLYRRPEGGIL